MGKRISRLGMGAGKITIHPGQVAIGVAIVAGLVVAAIQIRLSSTEPNHTPQDLKAIDDGLKGVVSPYDQYDVEGARRNLELLGKAIALYRQDFQAEQVEKRVSWSGLGLPHYLYPRFFAKGSKYELPIETHQKLFGNGLGSSNSVVPVRLKNQSGQSIFSMEGDVADLCPAVARYGDSLPIYYDSAMVELLDFEDSPTRKVLVLRLNGSVDLATANIKTDQILSVDELKFELSEQKR